MIDYESLGAVNSERSQIEIMLYLFAKWTQLPELYAFFAHDGQFLKFLREFGGTTLHIPSADRVARMFRNVRIWNALREVAPASGEGGKRFARLVKDMASMFEITENRVRAIYREVDAEVRKQGESLSGFLDSASKR